MAAPSRAPVSIPAFAAAHLALLTDELAAETALTSTQLATAAPAALGRAGLAATNLVLGARRTGLGGKTVLELEPDPALGGGGPRSANGATEDEPQHNLRVGDVVRVAPQPKGRERKREARALEARGADAVVTRVGRGAARGGLEVALDREDEDDGKQADALAGRVWVVKLANEATFKRMRWTLERLRTMAEREYTPLVRVLFGLDAPAPLPPDLEDPDRGPGKVEFLDPSLDDSQRDAVRFALAAREVALIHGPPGTGKTHTLVELIRQLVRRGQRVLACGPSNTAVDNLVERLAPCGVPMVRLGHPARLLPAVLDHSLDVLTRTSEAGALVKDVRAEMDAAQARAKKARSGAERRGLYGEIRELRKEYRQREARCVGGLVQGARVVLATLHGAGGRALRHERFDVVLVDEASQALEAQCWIPLLAAPKAVLAGDHLQLPPTVKSDRATGADGGPGRKPDEVTHGFRLETTLFDRLLALHGPAVKRMLTTQYRMHAAIMRFPAHELYEAKLVAAPSVAARLLTDLPRDVQDTEDTREPLVFWDTQGGDFPERAAAPEDDGGGTALGSDSKSNAMEAALAARHVERLIAAGVREADIAVITPYHAQRALLAGLVRARHPGVELGSVDGFQGREKEAVVLSLVRSNAHKEVGFLAERRRLNVAMTRPRRHLCVIGDAEHVAQGSPFLKRWMAHLEAEADLRYPDVSELQQT